MWIWNNTREHYFCARCYKVVNWYAPTGVGQCDCKIFIPNHVTSSPPGFLKGHFKDRLRRHVVGGNDEQI